MSLSDAEIRELIEKARAATPGKWTIPGPEDNTDDIIQADGKRICGCCCCGGFNRDEDSRFVEGANPAAVIALGEEVLRWRESERQKVRELLKDIE